MKVTDRSNRRTDPHSQTRKENGRSPKNGPDWMHARWVWDPGRGAPPVKQEDETKPRPTE
jgi:hypothetical protein